MKRNTDVSRFRPATLQESDETSAQPCCRDAERAAALLIHSMQQSDSPISELGSALARMAQTLSDIGTPLFGNTTAQAELQVFRDAFAREISVCIQSLQFHDRLMQQLTQARDLLTGGASNTILVQMPGTPANEGSIEGSVELF